MWLTNTVILGGKQLMGKLAGGPVNLLSWGPLHVALGCALCVHREENTDPNSSRPKASYATSREGSLQFEGWWCPGGRACQEKTPCEGCFLPLVSKIRVKKTFLLYHRISSSLFAPKMLKHFSIGDSSFLTVGRSFWEGKKSKRLMKYTSCAV